MQTLRVANRAARGGAGRAGGSANAQIAEAQRRLYWLDKLEVDLNALLSRPWLAFLATVPLKAFRRLRRESRQVLGRLRG